MSIKTETWFEDLGGHDCETCGWNPEEVEIERITDGEEVIWIGGFRVGCYGGGSYSSLSFDEVADYLKTELDDPRVRVLIERAKAEPAEDIEIEGDGE